MSTSPWIEAEVRNALLKPSWTKRERKRLALIAQRLEQGDHGMSVEDWAKLLWRLWPAQHASRPPRSRRRRPPVDPGKALKECA